MKRVTLFAVAILGVSVGLSGGAFAGPKDKGAKEKSVAETPLKANPALKAKFDKKITPWKWGMSSAEVFAQLEKDIDRIYGEKVSKAYNPKMQAQLEKEADKKKKDLRTKQIEFKGGAGVSGYEIKAPGEFTYKNNESAIEVARPGGGERQLFFINDKLWKVYDHVHLTAKDAELGETWDQALGMFQKDVGEPGKKVAAKSASPSYYGVLMVVPDHVLWSDGTTQVRFIDHTKREDMTVRTVGIAYEEIAMVEKLPTYRTNIEKKATDASVDKAGLGGDAPPAKDESKKKKK
ncbi:MAG: hypothetical protein HYV09_33985 [Deltaproteobacteria bacterium]|nr:hypothetical protein [Deltaproteobacteria bacterium]